MRQSAQSTHFETQTGILRNALLRSYLHSLTLSTQMNLDLVDFLAVAVIRSCLSSTSVIHYNLWFLFAYYHKRNVETKRLKAVSSSRPLSAILTQVGHYTCRTEARKEGEKEMLTSNKNSPRYYLFLVQIQIRDNNATQLLFVFY